MPKRAEPAAPTTPPPLVATDAGLAELIAVLAAEPRYALDTEFHRERTYYPQLALIQLAWEGGLALVDPVAVDVAPLAQVLDGPGVGIFHAAEQDLEVLERACGTVPATLFDTQIAAGFVGFNTPSLSTLVERELGVHLPKGDRLTDWLARPLDAGQLTYAAADVAHLLEIHRRLTEQLERRGRLQWALDECEALRLRNRGGRDPLEAWRRIKEARQMKGRARSVVRRVAAWREERAAATDQPTRFVLPDLAVISIAQRAPSSVEELRSLRGVDGRHLRSDVAPQILAAVEEGRHEKPPVDDAAPRELDRDLRPAVALVSAWVSQLSRDLELDTTLLATRTDIEAFLRRDEGARLATGWRHGVAGEPIRKLVSGEAALAFDGGHLVLEERSHRAPT